jgi:hypothetical protein
MERRGQLSGIPLLRASERQSYRETLLYQLPVQLLRETVSYLDA